MSSDEQHCFHRDCTFSKSTRSLHLSFNSFEHGLRTDECGLLSRHGDTLHNFHSELGKLTSSASYATPTPPGTTDSALWLWSSVSTIAYLWSVCTDGRLLQESRSSNACTRNSSRSPHSGTGQQRPTAGRTP